MKKKIGIIIAEDHKIVREGIVSCLKNEPDFEILGEAQNGLEAYDMTIQFNPDIVLMDNRMPNINGLQASKEIKEDRPNTKIIVLTAFDNDEYIDEFNKIGVEGFLLKNTTSEILISSIRKVFRGEKIVDKFVEQKSEEIKLNGSFNKDEPILTEKEQVILQMIAEGSTINEISAKLNISITTVTTFKENIKEKLNIQTSAGIVKYAIKAGLIKI